jgi:tetratricopeptide (TPR) repeat protein
MFAGLMSLSRGGAMALFAAVATSVLILYRCGKLSRKTLLALLGIGLFVTASLVTYGYDRVLAELDDFGSLEDLDRHGTRRGLWKAGAEAIADFPLLGTGLGSHPEVVPVYFQDESLGRFEYTHAENGYVQVAMETGIPGLVLVLIAIGLSAYWCVSSLRHDVPQRVRLCFVAIAPALAVSFLHSVADFVWYVPGCMAVVVLLAGCAYSLSRMSAQGRGTPAAQTWCPRPGWLVAACCLAVVGGAMVQNRLWAVAAEPAWYGYLKRSMALPDSGEGNKATTLRAMEAELSKTTERQPDHARAHARLAAIHKALFDCADDPGACPFTVEQVRDAALASNFASYAALSQWLDQAFGQRAKHLELARRHARRAASLSPLQGLAYLHLADLSFLEGPASPGKKKYIEQAVLVRPYDGPVLFEAGREAIVEGDWERAFACLRRAFRTTKETRKDILEFLAGRLPAAPLLELFQPRPAELDEIVLHYRRLGRPQDLEILLRHQAEVSENLAQTISGPPAAETWLKAAATYRALNDLPRSAQCLRNAVRCDATDVDARYALGKCLFELKQFGEAERHLKSCLQWRPDDAKLRAEVEAAMDRRLRTAGQAPREAH